jgi:hypothetical protein
MGAQAVKRVSRHQPQVQISACLWCVVDIALAHAIQEPGGRCKVRIVMQDDEFMPGCGGTDQQIDR